MFLFYFYFNISWWSRYSMFCLLRRLVEYIKVEEYRRLIHRCKYKELQIHHFVLFWSIISLFSRPFSLETRLYLVSWDCIKCILHHYLLIFPFDRSFTFLDFNPSHSFRLTIACATISLKRSHDVARGVTTVSCSDRLEQLHLLFVIWSRTTRTCTGPLRKLCTNCHVTRIIVLQCMVVVLSR